MAPKAADKTDKPEKPVADKLATEKTAADAKDKAAAELLEEIPEIDGIVKSIRKEDMSLLEIPEESFAS